MKNNLITLIKAILFVVISIYLSYSFNDSLANFVAKTPIGWVVGSIILRLLIALSFGRGIQLIIKSTKIKINTILVLFIGSLLGFGVSFGFQPIYNTDYGNWKSEDMILNMEEFEKHSTSYTKSNQAELFLFLSTSCPHCREVSKKIGFLQKHDKSPAVNAIFTGTKEDAEAFLLDNDGQNFNLTFVENDSIFNSFSAGRYPSIYLLDKDYKTAGHWFGGALNYSGLDEIESFK